MSSEPNTLREKLYCSFCGKSNSQIASLMAGVNVFICNECVALSALIMGKKDKPWRDQMIEDLRNLS